MDNTLFQNEAADEILNDIKTEYGKRDTLLIIYKKLRNYYARIVFLKLLMVSLPISLLYFYNPQPTGNILLAILFILFIPFIFSLNRFPTDILNQYELSTVNYTYGYLLYYDRDIGYMKSELADRIWDDLNETNKRIEELKDDKWHCELLDYEKDKYAQIRDKIYLVERKKNCIERLVESLKEQTTDNCLFNGLFTYSYPIAGFDFDDLELITSDSYLCEHFKSALINNNLDVKKSFKKDVVSYLSKIDDELKLVKDELSKFKKDTSQQKRLDFINAM